MNFHLEPQGFLGTGASLLSDISLLAYVLLIVPGMLAGFAFARRGQHRPHHKQVMIGITAVNWLLIIFLMIFAYRFDVIQNISQQPANTRYLIPTIHALFGLPAQLLATYVVFGMLREDSRVARAKARGETNLSKYWFRNAKTKMRLTIALWLITAAFGIFTYLIRYQVIPNRIFGGGVPAPIATEDVPAPVATEDPTPKATPEATLDTLAPVATEEITPVVTEEADLIAPAATEEGVPVATEEISDHEEDEDAEHDARDAVRATEDAIDDAEDAAEDATKAAEDRNEDANDDDDN